VQTPPYQASLVLSVTDEPVQHVENSLGPLIFGFGQPSILIYVSQQSQKAPGPLGLMSAIGDLSPTV
jgi:hypothetical protein